ncbi:MAG: hypothetical protein IJD10_04055 [Clostridia bacterium]|nr:hypothetical protein [Clostridia bacterium]
MENYERPTYPQSVRAVQTYLYTISQVDPQVPRVNPDGIYGPETGIIADQPAFSKFLKRKFPHGTSA